MDRIRMKVSGETHLVTRHRAARQRQGVACRKLQNIFYRGSSPKHSFRANLDRMLQFSSLTAEAAMVMKSLIAIGQAPEITADALRQVDNLLSHILRMGYHVEKSEQRNVDDIAAAYFATTYHAGGNFQPVNEHIYQVYRAWLHSGTIDQMEESQARAVFSKVSSRLQKYRIRVEIDGRLDLSPEKGTFQYWLGNCLAVLRRPDRYIDNANLCYSGFALDVLDQLLDHLPACFPAGMTVEALQFQSPNFVDFRPLLSPDGRKIEWTKHATCHHQIVTWKLVTEGLGQAYFQTLSAKRSDLEPLVRAISQDTFLGGKEVEAFGTAFRLYIASNGNLETTQKCLELDPVHPSAFATLGKIYEILQIEVPVPG